ncbi:MAG: hypothetical protein HRU28_15285 [Rhizobiales bacterium]|nr:hypothetical protein [Hyphomicrobiales bacterium]
MKKIIIASAFVLSMATIAFAGTPTIVSTDMGKILADDNGMTLYTFKKDVKGTSNCYGKCATAWSPFFVASGDKASGDLSFVTRKDGKMQWAHNGLPLYLWQGDASKGDTTGHNFKNAWFVVKQ